MPIDWKKVAQNRQEEIRRLERRLQNISAYAARTINNQMCMGFHAACMLSLSDPNTRRVIKLIAERAAEDITGFAAEVDDKAAK